MLRDAAVSILQTRLGNRTDLATDIVTEMQLVQIELEMMDDLPWFLITTDSALTTEAGEPDRLILPTDFIREVEEDALEYQDDNSDWIPLVKDDLEKIRVANLDAYATPSFYSILGSDLFLRPSPESQLTLRLSYFAKATVLNTNVENVWLANVPNLIIAETGKVMAQYLQNDKLFALFQASSNSAFDAMWTQNYKRMSANSDLRMNYRAAEE